MKCLGGNKLWRMFGFSFSVVVAAFLVSACEKENQQGQTPLLEVTFSPVECGFPITVQFHAIAIIHRSTCRYPNLIWTFGDGAASYFGYSATHVYRTPGVFLIHILVLMPDGLWYRSYVGKLVIRKCRPEEESDLKFHRAPEA